MNNRTIETERQSRLTKKVKCIDEIVKMDICNTYRTYEYMVRIRSD